MTSPGPDISAAGPLDALPLSRRQIGVIALALLLGMLDGFDALAMAFAAPSIAGEWHLVKATLGLLLSSGLIGMAIGSLALSPLADRIGRRPVVLGALAVMASGSLLSGLSTSVPLLFVWRVFTGVGIGVMVAMTTLISAEFANARRRTLAVALVATAGFPLGGVAGGLTASILLPTVGWPWVFFAGGIGGVVFLALAARFLPESPSYLAARHPPDQARLSRVLAELGHRGALAAAADGLERVGYGALFKRPLAGTTTRLVVVIVLQSSSAYYVLSWLPQFVADMGFSPAAGSRVSALSNLAGAPAGLLVGALAARFGPGRVAAAVLVGMGLSIAAVGQAPAQLLPIVVAAGCFGFFMSGSAGANYGIMAASFSPLLRASAIGLILGAGRVASALGPAAAGWLLSRGFSRLEVSLGFAAGPMIAAALIWTHALAERSELSLSSVGSGRRAYGTGDIDGE